MRNDQSNDDVLLESYRRYLLGELEEEDANDFERRLFMEPDLPVEALDSDLLAACDRKEFAPEQAQRILSQLTSSPPGRDRLALVQGLKTLADEAQARPRNNVRPFLRRLVDNRRPSHFLRAAVAVAATLLIAVGIMTVGDPAPSVAPAPAIFSLALSTVRGTNGIPQLEVPPETERVEIRIDIAGEEYPSYNLVLTDLASEREVAEKSGILPQALQGGDVLSLELQASSLPKGEYRLDVYGAEASGPPALLGAPEFEVLQTD